MSALATSVLVVDDERPVRDSIRSLLTAHDFDVLDAASGPEAIAKAQGGVPDLILLDLGLCHRDGLALLRRLHEGQVPIIVLSAGDRTEDRAALVAGAEYYLSKPVDEALLLHCIHAVLSDGNRP